MQKYTAKNLTNRTLQIHLPGGRYLRLAPGCSCSLHQSDCKLPAVKKMMRKKALVIPSLAPVEVLKEQAGKPQAKTDKKKTSAKAGKSSKTEESVSKESEETASDKERSELAQSLKPESAEGGKEAEHEVADESGQKSSSPRKKLSTKKQGSRKK